MTTTYTVAAIGSGGRQARSVTIEVLKEKPLRGEPKTWYIDWDPFRVDRYRLRDDRLWRQFRCAVTGPVITFAASPRAVFEDEETTLTWGITCSNCARMDGDYLHITLVEDLTRRSGTRGAFGEGGGFMAAPCSLEMAREADWTVFNGPGRYWWTISAEGSMGGHASATVEVGFMPHPLLSGECDLDRQSAIEGALKDVFERLLDGCIRDDAGLDDAIAAFEDGWVDRVAFWGSLVAQLENLNLITFRCNDTTDEEWRGSHWEEYGNIIDLEWSPNHAPRLAYAILHELIHKCGFNGELEVHYDLESIEAQALALTDACDL